jgi:two-component system invasion response regulator UvrY
MMSLTAPIRNTHRSMTTSTLRVVLADDHPLLMAGFATAIAKIVSAEIVGQTTSPDDVLEHYKSLRPDVLVLDVRFGDKISGFDVARQILLEFPDANIVFLSQFDQDTFVREAYRLGARAFVTKESSTEHLSNAVRAAAKGETYFLPDVKDKLAFIAIRGDTSPQALLDSRELDVLKGIAEGLTNLEIAERLEYSPKMISIISQGVKDKLGLHRPADLTRLAVKHGLITA